VFGATVRKGALSLTDQAVVSGCSFFTTVIVGRVCGPGELGIYSLGFTIVLLLTAVHLALVSMPYTVFGNRLGGSRRAEYAGAVLAHHLGLTVLVMLGLTAGAAVVSAGVGPSGLGRVMWVLSALIGFVLLREFARRFAFAQLDMRTALILDAAIAVLQIAGLLWLFSLGRLSAAGAFAVIGMSCGVAGLAWLGAIGRSFALRWKQVLPELRRNWLFGRWVLAGSITFVLHGYTIYWLIALVLGTEATGILAACMTVVMFFNPVLVAAGNVIIPQNARVFAAEGPVGVQRVVAKATLLLCTAMALYCGLVVFVGEHVVQLLYHNPAYAGHGHLIDVLALGMLASVLGTAPDSGLCALERPDLNFKANVLGLTATVTVTSLLLMPWGVLGAAYGLLAGNTTASLARMAAFLRVARRAQLGMAGT
jgi:O-antigen/teichoic acid export membrane protein